MAREHTDLEMLKAKRDALQEQYQAFGRALRDGNRAVKDELRDQGLLWRIEGTFCCGDASSEEGEDIEEVHRWVSIWEDNYHDGHLLESWRLYKGTKLVTKAEA